MFLLKSTMKYKHEKSQFLSTEIPNFAASEFHISIGIHKY